ncbi:MAG: 3-methyl-2-oxobutanoate hydroxymethyltransferase [bacterium]
MEKVTPMALFKMKEGAQKVTCLTAYDYPTALLLDEAGIDLVLVGDSLGSVIQGHDTTLPVSMDDMLYHTRAVARGVKRALVIGDMPFGSFQPSVENAVRNATDFLKAGANAVKIEGGMEVLPAVEAAVSFGIPVQAHVGLTPMKINAMGGYKAQGRTEAAAKRIFKEAQLLQDAGAFSVVLESIPWKLAQVITEELKIPTIGIGSGPHCDGQVLVWHDAMGLLPGPHPRHVKEFFEGWKVLHEAVGKFIEEVRGGRFPEEKHSFELKEFDPETLRRGEREGSRNT